MNQLSSLLTTAALLTAVALQPACTTLKKYDDLKARQAKTEEDKNTAQKQQQQAVAELQKATDELTQLRLERKRLVTDSTQTGTALRKTQSLYHELTDSYEKLLKNNDRALSEKSAEYGKVAKDLARREAELGELDQNLKKSRAESDKLSADLKAREAKMLELEKALADKDKAVNDLKARVSNALLSFKSNELQVRLKDGKVYVSLSEQLLFKSGSAKVDPKGQEALKKLATVLQEQQDVNVVVEGHTDDQPILKGTAGLQDNWDLSVLRATEIARLLTVSGVAPARVTASGRSQYVPVDAAKTAEARQKNRRTEIILTPKLDDLFQILDTNTTTGGTK